VVVIAGLIMVISQAAGWEVIDAYTIKKMMPRLVVAVIAIALSWQLCKTFITFCDVLGFGVRNLIYAPFNSGGGHFEIGSGTSSVLALIGTGGVLTLGIFATLSLALTAFMAVATGFVFLVLRLGLIFFLVIVAPLAIACSILPNTQKLFKMWWGAFRDMGLAFALIAGAIALGRVLAYVNYKGSNASGNASVNGLKGLVLQLIAIVFYFGVYFMIPVIFRMIGGFIGTLSGFVNDRSRGAFDRLKQFRSNTAKARSKEMKQGTLLEGKSWVPGSRTLAKGFNRTTMGIGMGAKGRFGLPTARGRAGVAQTRSVAADELRNTADFVKIKENDYALRAATYRSSGEAMSGMTQYFKDSGKGDEEATAMARNAVGAAQASVGFGAVQQIAAAKGLYDTGTGYTNLKDAVGVASRVANGNADTGSEIAGYGNAMAKNKGNWHLAPSYGDFSNLVQANLSGQKITDAAYDDATLKALGNSTSPGQLVGTAKPNVFNEAQAINERLLKVKSGTLSAEAYGATPSQVDELGNALTARAVEWRENNYGMASVEGAAVSAQIREQRADAINALEGSMEQAGLIRRYNPYGSSAARGPLPGEPGGPAAGPPG